MSTHDMPTPERLAILLAAVDAEERRDVSGDLDGFEIGDYERGPHTRMQRRELRALLMAAQRSPLTVTIARSALPIVQRLAVAEGLLRELEFVDYGDGLRCPICGYRKKFGHTTACSLAAFLAPAPATPVPTDEPTLDAATAPVNPNLGPGWVVGDGLTGRESGGRPVSASDVVWKHQPKDDER